MDQLQVVLLQYRFVQLQVPAHSGLMTLARSPANIPCGVRRDLALESVLAVVTTIDLVVTTYPS